MKRCPSCQSAFPTNYTHCPRDGSSLTEASDWSAGTVVRGKYQIIGKVGQGGMAAVYKALHVRFKEPRALKVINPELANDASFVRRFEQEAIVTRKLQHPNAVRVDDIDEAEDGRPFIVMEFVEGGNLKDVIEQEAPLPVARVCSIVKQVAAALDAAHRLGLVHRDIKPANIAMVRSAYGVQTSSGDHVKVLDFGIAKLKEAHVEESKVSHMTLTGTGMVIGTPAYMSPEQAKGLKGEQLDGRSDIYSLGVVAYQMLTGDLPLKADSTLELLMAHVNTPPRPMHEVRPDLGIPDAVAAVVMRCLEKKREQRPASGQALIDEIEFAVNRARLATVKPSRVTSELQGPPLPTTESPTGPETAKQSRARHSRTQLAAVTAILVGGFLGSILYLLGTKSPVVNEGSRVETTSAATKPVAPPTTEPLVPAPVPEVPAKAKPPKPALVGPVRKESGLTPTKGGSSRTAVAPLPSNSIPSSAPVPTTGPPLLEIHTKPAVVVVVYVDDMPLGSTNPDGQLKVTGMAQGRHRLWLDARPAYQPYEDTVDLVAGLNTKWITLMSMAAGGPVTAATQRPATEEGSSQAQSLDNNAGRLEVNAKHNHPLAGHCRGVFSVDSFGIEFRSQDKPKHSFKYSFADLVKAEPLFEKMWPGQFQVQSRSGSLWYLEISVSRGQDARAQRDNILSKIRAGMTR